jgi:maltooligosyltrehalose trehalohydrolase
LVEGVGPGVRYRFQLDGEEALLPDPASRYQPEGVHGPSEVVDPSQFEWSDRGWPGLEREGQVIYELHVGTFTREGTWEAAACRLASLAELGVTVIEMMPVAEFAGQFGWGYDGVDLFAPSHLYGKPDDLRRFIDSAHAVGIGVILDVVYNHLGPDGNTLPAFSPDYFSEKHQCEWGEAINFDGEGAGPVREFFVSNAGYWIDEYHFDGLRLDATQQIFDDSERNVMAELTRRVREAARGRHTLVVAENQPQHTQLVRPESQGGLGMDALWNDDFHHAVRVALTGKNEFYYMDYLGSPQELVSAAKRGFLYQGQRYLLSKKPQGTSTRGLPPSAFVNFIQNHDQVANSARGLRIQALTSPGRFRAISAYLLLAPGTPMLFQGQEFASSSPFYYFCDHHDKLAPLVSRGRGEFLSQFPSIAPEETRAYLADPCDRRTFEACKLNHSERDRPPHQEIYELHRDLLRLRREDETFHEPRAGGVDGAVLGDEAFALRFFGRNDEQDDRLLIVNLGRDLRLAPAPEPLLAPPENASWRVLWSSEAPAYGGGGTPGLEDEQGLRLPGHTAVVLVPREA